MTIVVPIIQISRWNCSLQLNIERRRWSKFCALPQAAVVSIVQEFHSNAIAHKKQVVFIRKQRVSFTPNVINKYYSTPDVGTDEYSIYARDHVNLNGIINTICVPETTWKTTTSESNIFSASTLTWYTKAWYYFFTTKMMFVSHMRMWPRNGLFCYMHLWKACL